MKIGSLCTGYGGLDMAVEAVFNAETVWVSEIDKYASKVIEQRFNVINLGDLKTIDWHSVEPIDILTAGYPCQPFSHAGYRKGLEDERHIFPYILEAISVVRPRIVVMENVRGHLSLGLVEVLKGLSSIGYDAKWRVVRASDVGAPHQRARLFIIAYPNSDACPQPRRTNRSIHGSTSKIINRTDRKIDGCSCTPACDPNNEYKSYNRALQELGRRFATRCEMSVQAAPNTMENNTLNAKYVEYMMGLPEGWVTETGLSRAQQLKMLGNGVVPQQAECAIRQLLNQETPF